MTARNMFIPLVKCSPCSPLLYCVIVFVLSCPVLTFSKANIRFNDSSKALESLGNHHALRNKTTFLKTFLPHSNDDTHTLFTYLNSKLKRIRKETSAILSNETEELEGKHHYPIAPEKHGNGTPTEVHGKEGSHVEVHGIHVASWNYNYVRQPLMLTLILMVAAIVKLLYHHTSILSSHVPESCILILLGIGIGTILWETGSADTFPKLSPPLFFLYLLPPVILESAYSLHDRTFTENLGTVLMYAVIGTLLNFFLIGLLLYALNVAGLISGLSMSLKHCLLFAALIVAVDPVAVLAIFQEVGVNNTLYILVFGESLLNDAVTVVLYNMMTAFSQMETIEAGQVGLAIAAFFSVSIGGIVIGGIFGFLTAVFTKYTEHVRVLEPLALFMLAYGSYLTAELFHFSGIISIICCGLVQAEYSFHNISRKSYTTVKYFIKMHAAMSDTIIFAFLGVGLIKDSHVWHTAFCLFTLLLCFVVRAFFVMVLTYIRNKVLKTNSINWEEQFIMMYGGLRGAVCFSLSEMMDDSVPHKQLFQTCTLVVILFTVFIQGTSIKPLVKLLRIRTKDEKANSLLEEFNTHMVDHCMAGVEEVLGHHGENFWRQYFIRLDHKYLKKWLQRNPRTENQNIMNMYERIALKEHFAALSGCAPTEIGEEKGLLDYEGNGELYPMPEEDAEEDHSHAKHRRKSRSKSVSDNVTASDLRKLMESNPANNIHRKYDPNITMDDDEDLMNVLKEKSKRTRRFANAMAAATPGGTPAGSTQFALTQDSLDHLRNLHAAALHRPEDDEENADTADKFEESHSPPPVSTAEKKRRMSEGLCYSIGQQANANRRQSVNLQKRKDLLPLARRLMQAGNVFPVTPGTILEEEEEEESPPNPRMANLRRGSVNALQSAKGPGKRNQFDNQHLPNTLMEDDEEEEDSSEEHSDTNETKTKEGTVSFSNAGDEKDHLEMSPDRRSVDLLLSESQNGSGQTSLQPSNSGNAQSSQPFDSEQNRKDDGDSTSNLHSNEKSVESRL